MSIICVSLIFPPVKQFTSTKYLLVVKEKLYFQCKSGTCNLILPINICFLFHRQKPFIAR